VLAFWLTTSAQFPRPHGWWLANLINDCKTYLLQTLKNFDPNTATKRSVWLQRALLRRKDINTQNIIRIVNKNMDVDLERSLGYPIDGQSLRPSASTSGTDPTRRRQVRSVAFMYSGEGYNLHLPSLSSSNLQHPKTHPPFSQQSNNYSWGSVRKPHFLQAQHASGHHFYLRN